METKGKRTHQQEPGGSTRKIEEIYTFFLQAEQEERIIWLSDIQAVAGYTEGTAKIYTKKKWWWFLASRPGGGYLVHGLKGHPLEEFLDLHRQKRGPRSTPTQPRPPLWDGEKSLVGINGEVPTEWELQIIALPSTMVRWLGVQANYERRAVDAIVADAIEQYRQTSQIT